MARKRKNYKIVDPDLGV
jgi:hypothetical protein